MTTAPKTRRQLRKALEKAELRAKWAKNDYDQQSRSLEKLKEQVEADGWAPIYAPNNGFIVTDLLNGKRTAPIIGWEAPDREEHRKAIEDNIRRETLKKVLEALGIEGYSRYGYPRVGLNGTIEQVRSSLDADKFWDDLQTALEHRAAVKHTETQRKTAEKVAGLTKKLVVGGKAGTDGELLVDGGILPGKIPASDINANRIPTSAINVPKITAPVIDFSPEATKRLAEQIAEDLAPKKKPGKGDKK